MSGKRVLYALAVVVLMGAMAVPVWAGDQGTNVYRPAETSMSHDQDAWDLREAMETGALPGQPVGSSEDVCCRGTEGATIESGGQLFRPDVDSGA